MATMNRKPASLLRVPNWTQAVECGSMVGWIETASHTRPRTESSHSEWDLGPDEFESHAQTTKSDSGIRDCTKPSSNLTAYIGPISVLSAARISHVAKVPLSLITFTWLPTAYFGAAKPESSCLSSLLGGPDSPSASSGRRSHWSQVPPKSSSSSSAPKPNASTVSMSLSSDISSKGPSCAAGPPMPTMFETDKKQSKFIYV
mmetsp:Transcript_71390/g.149181  ORF Transcript_71390/g.149181 Transcript_71390/m.149181 type:complete len:202 (+) Transcript_71390:58-663(+)